MPYCHNQRLLLLILAVMASCMCCYTNEVHVSQRKSLSNSQNSIYMQAKMSESFDLQHSLHFEPAHLDFGVWSIGTVRSHMVTLINMNTNHSVYVSAISGSVPAFYNINFEEKLIPPMNNITFNVIFLPRSAGLISSNLHVQTSFGDLFLKMCGEGRPSPYRLQPLLGFKAPLNATVMPEISMYNPHERKLQILELYVSSDHFQLEMPQSDMEHSPWELEPFTTKSIIRIRFHGVTAGNHSAYMHIKIAEPLEDLTTPSENILVIPIEIEIMLGYGLYAVNPLIDFGYLPIDASYESLQHKVILRHSKYEEDMTSSTMINTMINESLTDGIKFDSSQRIIILNLEELTKMNINECFALSLVSNDESETVFTYQHIHFLIRCNVFKGSLHYDRNVTTYTPYNIDERHRHLIITNYFQLPLAIFNISIKSAHNFLTLRVKSLLTAVILRPHSSLDIMSFSLVTKDPQDLNYKTVVYVYTNLTCFEIPIVLCSGRLQIFTQSDPIWYSNSTYSTKLNLVSKPQKSYIILENRNPFQIKLDHWNIPMAIAVQYSISFLGCVKATKKKRNDGYSVLNLLQINFSINNELNEGDLAVFRIDIKPHTTSLLQWGDLKVTQLLFMTTKFENITVAITLFLSNGRVEVDQEKLHFENCFPGKLCSSDLSLRSTFHFPLHIHNINFSELGLKFEDFHNNGSKIAPGSVTTVGRIYFEPEVLCGSQCYIPSFTGEAIAFPTNNIVQNKLNLPYFNEVELRRRTELYRHFKWYFQNIDFIMTTKDATQFQLNLIVEFKWPQLVSGFQSLPLIQVNKTCQYAVIIKNPADKPILVDYYLADPTIAQNTHLSLPVEVIDIANCYLTDQTVFSLVHKSPSKPVLIPNGTSLSIPVEFTSSSAGTYCTLLHMRNNLTLYEAVWLSAKSVQSQFRLGNRLPNTNTILIFDITEKQFDENCISKLEINLQSQVRRLKSHSEKKFDFNVDNVYANEVNMENFVVPELVIRRVFIANNLGQLSIWIESIHIGDEPCMGYGFNITDCFPFELKANSSRKIEITFRSDFSTRRIVRPLRFKTNDSIEFSYTLMAKLPNRSLDSCLTLVPRPSWESLFRNAAIFMLAFSFIFVHIAVHIDYSNIFYNQSLLFLARDNQQILPTFDLRNIALQTIIATTPTTTELSNCVVKSSNGCNLESNVKNKEIKEKNPTNTGGSNNLKKRNISKHQKVTNDVSKVVTTTSLCKLSLTDVVTWTLSKGGGRKSTITTTIANSALNNTSTKIYKDDTNTTVTNTSSKISSNINVGCGKIKNQEKLAIMEKMDNGIKQKSTSTLKLTHSNNQQNHSKKSKVMNEENIEKDNRKEKADHKITPVITNISTTTTIGEGLMSFTVIQKKNESRQATPSPRKTITNISNTLSVGSSSITPPANNHGRKLGKTPGRERRKHTQQNTSIEAINSNYSSTSSSSSSSSSYTSLPLSIYNQQQQNNGKKIERKNKLKVANSLKYRLTPTLSLSSITSPTSSSTNSSKFQSIINPNMSNNITSSLDNNTSTLSDMIYFRGNCITSPWETNSQVTFCDVLQSEASKAATANLNNDLRTHSLLNDIKSMPPETLSSTNNSKNVNISTFTPKKTPYQQEKPDLGPIGSKKSPSSTPIWESLNNTTVLPPQRPFLTASYRSDLLSSSASAMNNNSFGYDNPTNPMFSQCTMTQTHQGHNCYEFLDVSNQLNKMKPAQEDYQRILHASESFNTYSQQQSMQSQQVPLSNNWSILWSTEGVNGNNGNGGGGLSANDNSSLSMDSTINFRHQIPQQELWPLRAPMAMRPTPEVVKINQNCEQPQQNSTSSCSVTQLQNNGNSSIDNMPQFDPFGLSSIWTDGWKQQSQMDTTQQLNIKTGLRYKHQNQNQARKMNDSM